MTPVDLSLLEPMLLAALKEDVGSGDLTTRATVPEDARATGRFTAKQALVVAGVEVVRLLVRLVDQGLEFKTVTPDRTSVVAGTALAEMRGSARSVLIAERTALNLLQRMCG